MKILYHQSSMTDCCTQVNYSPETSRTVIVRNRYMRLIIVWEALCCLKETIICAHIILEGGETHKPKGNIKCEKLNEISNMNPIRSYNM